MYIQNMEKHGFALTSKVVKQLAYSFLVQHNIPNSLNVTKQLEVNGSEETERIINL